MSMELPEHLRTGPLAEAAAKALADANSMAAASNSIPRVSLRGREFRFIEGGEEVAKVRQAVDVIILGVEPDAGRMVKTWYKNGYSPGAKEPPTCQSDDGIAPSPWVTEKVNPTCANCPKNQFGSAISPNGKQTKACRDSKRVWLKRADDPKPFSDRTTYGMNVTVASLKSFADFGKQLAGLGQGPAVCVTTMTMADSEFPQVDFTLKAWLDADLAPQSLKLSADRPWKIDYKHAGLALAAPEGGTIKSALPSALPGLPAHLQKAAEETVVDATPSGAKPMADVNVDDVIDKF
jgi:hypothetical protein